MELHPHSTAAVHIARMPARECLVPRRSRGSGDQREAPREIAAAGGVQAGGVRGQCLQRGISG
jgi:hypothetical protein